MLYSLPVIYGVLCLNAFCIIPSPYVKDRVWRFAGIQGKRIDRHKVLLFPHILEPVVKFNKVI